MFDGSGEGIIYITTSDRFVEEAKISAESVKSVMPNVPISIITDVDVSDSVFDDRIPIDDPQYGFGDKVYHLERTPYERTIFLDTDIYVAEPITELFSVLDKFDIAVANNQSNYASNRIDYEPVNKLPDSFPERNTGVIAYRSSTAMHEFLTKWKKSYDIISSMGQNMDQSSFRLSLYRSDVRIATLPSEYNCRFRNPGAVNGKVKIFHGRLIEVEGMGAKKNVEIMPVVEELNRKTGQRAYYRVGDKIKIAEPSVYQRGKYSLKKNGCTGVLKQIPSIIKRKIDKNETY